MKLMYDLTSLFSAADYLAENNKTAKKSSVAWFSSIYNSMLEGARREDCSCIATGGYCITFSQDGDCIFAEISVDCGVSKEPNYTTVLLDEYEDNEGCSE